MRKARSLNYLSFVVNYCSQIISQYSTEKEVDDAFQTLKITGTGLLNDTERLMSNSFDDKSMPNHLHMYANNEKESFIIFDKLPEELGVKEKAHHHLAMHFTFLNVIFESDNYQSNKIRHVQTILIFLNKIDDKINQLIEENKRPDHNIDNSLTVFLQNPTAGVELLKTAYNDSEGLESQSINLIQSELRCITRFEDVFSKDQQKDIIKILNSFFRPTLGDRVFLVKRW